MVDITKYLADRKAFVETQMERLIPGSNRRPAVIHEAMRYSLFIGGKRLRPILCLAACEACGGERETAVLPAVALECLHTYTLIHDDLPAMDDDDLRRGCATSHKKYGEAVAILAGDALLTLAFELLGRADRLVPCGSGVLVTELAQAAGSQGVVGGQVEDMLAEQEGGDGLRLEYIHRHKTACLIEASCRLGGLVAGATEVQLRALTAFARHIGLAFQIADDILDMLADETLLGKPVGSDAASGKLTYVSLHGVDHARNEALRLKEAACSALDAFDPASVELFVSLASYIVRRLH